MKTATLIALCLIPMVGHAQVNRYEDLFWGAGPDDIWGEKWPETFTRPLCLTPSYYLYSSPCGIMDYGYVDEHRRFHFTRRLTSRQRRAVIKHLVDSGM